MNTSILQVPEGFRLADLDRASTPGWKHSRKKAVARTARLGEELSELQERLYAHGRTGGSQAVLVVVQGMDTSGKGGIARHVFGMVDPQGVALRSFGVPTAEERRHHFLWRVRRALPRPGYIGLFDRSHYEDVLVARVANLVPAEVWEKRYDEINRFEEKIANSGTRIIKVVLAISYAEQGLRLAKRLERADKHWKYSPSDVDTRERWADYTEAYQAVLDRTSTPCAPWHVVPADHKWYARLAVTELLRGTLRDMDLDWPDADFDVEVERQRLAATL
ncbi:MAG: PPK2 family polyphosphate kinase [Cellulomonadaceae bacterium]